MKNFKVLIAILTTAVICISGTTLAAIKYQASEVKYKDNKTVEQALNELYDSRNLKYIIKDGKINQNICNMGVYSDGGYTCQDNYDKDGYIQLIQAGGTQAHAYYPNLKMVMNSNNMKKYSKICIELSYDYNSTYKGIQMYLNMYDNNGNKVKSNLKGVSGYYGEEKKFERKVVVGEIDTQNLNVAELVLNCYTCDSGTATANIYNLWFE